MIELSLNKVCKSYGFDKVLDDVSFEVKTNERVALIGPNGCGKSTILKIIAGLENITSGSLSIRQNIKVGYLSQIPEVEDIKVIDYLYSGMKDILDLKERLNKLEKSLEKDYSNSNITKYLKVQEEFISKNGYIIDEEVNKIINVFKIDKKIIESNFNSLSGGEKTIVSLARLILSKPDLLLLDEPTNHLDINALEWLEQYLNNYKGAILLVSHDRYFLDKVVTKTILLERGNTTVFHGNYSYYLKENEKLEMLEFKSYQDQQKKIEAMKDAIHKLREWGKIGDNEKFFKRAANLEKRLEAMDKVSKPITKKEIPLSFSGERSGKDVIKIKDLTLSYPNKMLLDNISFYVNYKDRVCLMGDNGSGKSTLIKYILNNKDVLGTNIKIGYIPQEIKFETDSTILEEARKYFIGNETQLRSSLAHFLFYNENVYKKISKLSGGEKVRLKLFCLMQQEVNLLVLDEITNHIDIDTRETLEDALSSYNGTILFISHDRYFINKIANRVVHIENCKLVNYIGNYDDAKRQNMV